MGALRTMAEIAEAGGFKGRCITSRVDKATGQLVSRECRASELTHQDHGQHLSFKDQIMRGYQRQEARGSAINGRKTGIKKIWAAA